MVRRMARDTADRAIAEERRTHVARYRLQRLSVREIAERLAVDGLRNPTTSQPWDHATVHRDCRALALEWRRDALADTARRTGEVLAELREVRRQAWAAGDLNVVLRALKQEAELLGLDAPTRVDFTALIRLDAERAGLDPDEMVRVAEQVLRESRT